MSESICPTCQSSGRQVKAGLHNGMQRIKCMSCRRRYIVGAEHVSYPTDVRRSALAMRGDGISMREIGRRLNVNPRTVVNWVHASQPVADAPEAAPQAGFPPRQIDPAPARSIDPPARLMRRNTIVDVARLAGVSMTTVSNYLNDRGRMSPETKERVRDAMASLHFTPNSLIRAIRQRQTHIIGVVTYGLYNLDEVRGTSITRGLLSGVNEAADRNKRNVLLYTGWPHRVTRTTGLEFLDGHIDGLVWVAPSTGEPHFQTVVESGLPAVGLLTSCVPEGAAFVCADNAGGMRQVVAHLAALGHRRIGYIGPNDVSDFVERSEGFRAAMTEHEIELRSDLVRLISEETSWIDFGKQECEGAVQSLLALADPPTAIVVGNDQLASRAIDKLTALGMRVPADISVTGFDGSVLSARIGLTTVRQDFKAMGEAAVEALVRLMEGAPLSECRIRDEVALIARGSTGPRA